jgi:hypothetical protein
VLPPQFCSSHARSVSSSFTVWMHFIAVFEEHHKTAGSTLGIDPARSSQTFCEPPGCGND